MDRQLRIYTRKNLKPNFFEGIFRKYSITNWLIIINVTVFLLALLMMSIVGAETVFSWIALQPNAFFSGQIWPLLTSMFMHGNFTHLFVNMVSLFFIGNFIEKLVGRKRFFWLYMISGIIAGLMFVFLAYFLGVNGIGIKIFGSPLIPAVGASGAIFGLGGLLAVLTPRLPVLVFFVIPMPMWAAMGFLMFGLWAISLGMGLPIGNVAHLGGLLVGLGYGFYLKKKYPRKTKMISNYFTR